MTMSDMSHKTLAIYRQGKARGEMERRRDGEMERRRDGEMERWRDGERVGHFGVDSGELLFHWLAHVLLPARPHL